MIKVLVFVVGLLLLLGFVWSLRQPMPGLYPDGIVPVKDGDLEWLNLR
jgi:hypothetical protein